MYTVRGRSYDPDPNQKLGAGSEGAVYPFPPNKDQCVKLFHEAEPGDKEGAALAAYRAKKIAAICRMNLHLSPQFVMPIEAAFDPKGNVSGFVMPKVKPGFVKILELLKPQWRAANNIGLKETVLLYSRLYADLEELEANSMAIGDINAGCVMINPDLQHSRVDMDSCSYRGFPCLATTELYAHPDLYPNLEKGKPFVLPQVRHDRFATVVMFTQMALQGAHPFRMGIHPKYTSLRERASHGVTIFDNGVNYPKVLPPPEILSDELLDRMIAILKRKTEDRQFGQALIEFASSVVSCSQCGAEYHSSRAHCPKCHEKTIVQVIALVKFIIEKLYAAPTRMLRVQMVGKELRTVTQVQGFVQITNVDPLTGSVVKIPTSIQAVKGAKYQFFADCLVVTKDPFAPPPVALELYRIEGKTVTRLSDVSTGSLENGQALVQTSERFLYRTAGNALMCGRMFGPNLLMEEAVSQVHQTQTWFTVDRTAGTEREALFGYDRALREIQWFVIKGDKEGNKFSYHEVKLAAMRSAEKLVDFAVYFSKDSVLLVRKTALKGKEFVRYSRIRLDDGKVDTDELLDEKSTGFDCWDNISGKFFQGESVLHVTPKGVVKQTLSDNQYSHMEDTDGVVKMSDQLFRCGSKVGVVSDLNILTIAKK